MLYEAEQVGDWRRWYLMTTPELRKEMSFEQFLEETGQREFAIVSWRIRQVRAENPSNLPAGIEAGAIVSMRIAMDHNSGRRETDDEQTDYWAYIDGEWYWSWRGWPDD
jgi:hypothetical protein